MAKDVARKDKGRTWWLAAVWSFFVPGVGQLYNGQPNKAVPLLCIQAGVVSQAYWAMSSYAGLAGLGICHFLFQIAAAIDAGRCARTVSSKRDWYQRWYVYPLLSAAMMALVFAQIQLLIPYKPFRIPSSAMWPTIGGGDVIIVTKGLDTATLARGDLIVFRSTGPSPGRRPGPPSTRLHIFRVIALPGETIELRSELEVLIDGEKLDEPWAPQITERLPRSKPLPPTKVEADTVFVLGDNRNNAADSRFQGAVRFEQIYGRALYIWESVDGSRDGRSLHVKHR